MRTYVYEKVYDYMVGCGLDDETEVFEEILHSVVGMVCDTHYGRPETLLEAGTRLRWYKIRARYPDGEAREHCPTQTEVFMGWKMSVKEQTDDFWSLWELLEELMLVAGGAKGEWEGANGVSVGKGAGTAASVVDAAESACDESVSEHGVESGGRSGTEAGAVEEEYLDYGAEDEETTTDRILRAIGFRSESQCRDEVGVSGEEPGEPSDETGRVERRKKSFPGLPPMSEHRTTLYAQGLCR